MIELTGGPFLATMPPFGHHPNQVQLGLDRADLDERVEARVTAMMAAGFLDEVRGLLPAGLRQSPTAGKALGYAQLLSCIDDNGTVVGDLDEAVAITVRATRRFARRQRSWFRRDPRVHWLDAAAPDLLTGAIGHRPFYACAVTLRVVKGHATENDFVLIDDRDGLLELTPALVQALCDRHAGIGADGVLRVVRCANDPAAAAMAAEAEFFMDYRNADGTVAEMCGNGSRLFLRYLQSAGLAGPSTTVATRGGVRRLWTESDGLITVEMGQARVLDDVRKVHVAGGAPMVGIGIYVPNPHIVVAVANADELAAFDLSTAPIVEPPLPEGQNVELVVTLGPRHIALRVNERGVGETRSCGTGICAAVVATAGPSGNDGRPWQVDVPGGRCQVSWRPDGELVLTGPAQLVGEIDIDPTWLSAASDTMERR